MVEQNELSTHELRSTRSTNEVSIPIGGNTSAFSRVYRVEVPNPNSESTTHRDDQTMSDEVVEQRPGVVIIYGPPTRPRVQFRDVSDTERQQQTNRTETNTNDLNGAQLPHAYPVGQVLRVDGHHIPPVTRNNSVRREKSERKIIVLYYVCLFFMVFATFSVIIIETSGGLFKNDDNANIVGTVLHEEGNNSTKESVQTAENNISDKEENFTCFKDPWRINLLEWEAHERGDDPSIPRTYHFCPNTVINVFGFDRRTNSFTQSEGVHPLVLFRSNVNIICGTDGELHSNCTFANGLFQILIHRTAMFIDYSLNSNAENITVKGFHFTNAIEGYNIISRSPRMSLTVQNCHFHNNNKMTASIQMTMAHTESVEVLVDKCIFENNTYAHNPNCYTDTAQVTELWKTAPNVGAILSFPMNSTNATVKTHVSNSLFLNNRFLLSTVDMVYTTGGIINLLPPVSTVEVTDTCFIGNDGYSSGLILLSGEYEETFSGNYFNENFPNELSDLSCTLMQQDISYNTPNSLGTVSVEKYCAKYVDSQKSHSDFVFGEKLDSENTMKKTLSCFRVLARKM